MAPSVMMSRTKYFCCCCDWNCEAYWAARLITYLGRECACTRAVGGWACGRARDKWMRLAREVR